MNLYNLNNQKLIANYAEHISARDKAQRSGQVNNAGLIIFLSALTRFFQGFTITQKVNIRATYICDPKASE